MKIYFVLANELIREVSVQPGDTLMRAAVQSQVDGIRAECGGQCLCATCHCYVGSHWVDLLPPKLPKEADLIDFVWEPKPSSRLACQIQLTPILDGLTVYIPDHQL